MTSRSRSDVQIMLTASQSGNSATNAAKDGANSSLVFDAALPEAYATLDTVQKEHAKYNSNQVRNPESQERDADPLKQFDGVSPSEGSMSVAGVTVGSEGGGSGGGVVPDPPSSLSRPRRRFEAKNTLYEDHELPPDSLKHRSLHAGSYDVYPDKTKEASYITCRCKTRTLVVTFFTGLALVLALAALVLSILLWFGLYESSSSSSSTSPTSMPTDCTCPTEEEVEQVKSELAAVKELFESVKNRSAQNVIRRDSLSQQMSWLQLNLTHLSNDLASLPQERKFVIPNVTVFDGCTKTLPQVLSCNIVTVPSGYVVEPCLSAYAPVEEEGTILLNAECIITGPSIPEGEVISATLEMFDIDGVDQMRCRCSRILDHPGQNVDNTLSHVCSLIATRCPRTIDVNTTLVWQPAK